jgi:hypothetical protein
MTHELKLKTEMHLSTDDTEVVIKRKLNVFDGEPMMSVIERVAIVPATVTAHNPGAYTVQVDKTAASVTVSASSQYMDYQDAAERAVSAFADEMNVYMRPEMGDFVDFLVDFVS